MDNAKISEDTGEPCIDADWECPKCKKHNTMEIDLYNLSICLTRCEQCDAPCAVKWYVELSSQAGLLKEEASVLCGPPRGAK